MVWWRYRCFFQEVESINTFNFIIYLKDGNVPIGNISFDRNIEELKSTEIACYLYPKYWGNGYVKEALIELAFNTHPDYWRKGYTYEALVAIINFLFEQGYDNLICCYDERNISSKNLGKKLVIIPYDGNNKIWEKNGVKITSMQ